MDHVLVCVHSIVLYEDREKENQHMKYLVVGAEGPGFASPEEALEVLEKGILPTFDALMQLEEDEKILAGGLPIGDRALVFIAEAASNEELDRMLRSIPAWGVLKWEVSALQTFAGRAEQEREIVEELKGAS
jgi:hypothetical protein